MANSVPVIPIRSANTIRLHINLISQYTKLYTIAIIRRQSIFYLTQTLYGSTGMDTTLTKRLQIVGDTNMASLLLCIKVKILTYNYYSIDYLLDHFQRKCIIINESIFAYILLIWYLEYIFKYRIL